MKYVSPEYIDEIGVASGLKDATSDEDVINVVLSAIYHCDTQFAADALLEAYQKVSGVNRLYLGNITQTFLGMHCTAYRIDELIAEMRKEGPDPIQMSDNIEAAVEYKAMFKHKPSH